jgi:hypothetical protein
VGKDFVDQLMAEILVQALELGPTQALAIERRIRTTWGGCEVYIGKKAAAGKVQRLGEELAAGTPLVQALENASLSRRHGYRALSRRWRFR